MPGDPNYGRSDGGGFSGHGDNSPGSIEHFRYRWSERQRQGWSKDAFIREYNQGYGTNFDADDLDGSGGGGFDDDDDGGGIGEDLPNAPSGPSQAEIEARDRERKDAYATIVSILTDYALEELAPWVWSQILADVPEAQIFIELRKQPAYKRRFPGMAARQAKGLRAMSEDEYLRAEESYRQVMRRWGFDVSKYDDPNDFTRFFQGDISPDEVNERGEIWYAISRAPNTTARLKAMIKQYTGTANVNEQQLFQALVEGDSALLQQLNIGLTNGGITVASLEDLKANIQRAYQSEAALFEGGGGRIASSGPYRVGLSGASTERFT